MRRGKNVAIASEYLNKALELITSENELLHLKLKYPSAFESQRSALSEIYLDKNVSLLNLLEIIVPLVDIGIIHNFDGTPVSFAQLVRSFEWLFNVNFDGGERTLKSKLISRKRGETKFLDKLIRTLLELNLNNLPTRK